MNFGEAVQRGARQVVGVSAWVVVLLRMNFGKGLGVSTNSWRGVFLDSAVRRIF